MSCGRSRERRTDRRATHTEEVTHQAEDWGLHQGSGSEVAHRVDPEPILHPGLFQR